MNLYLIRHADAGDPKQWRGDDSDRPLTDLGRRQARALGETLRRLGHHVGAVVTSPYVRTRQTAEELLAGGPAGIATLDSYLLTPGGLRRRRLSKEVAEPKADHVAVVGHNPELSAYLAWMIGAEEEAAQLVKGGAALVTFDNRPRKGTGRLAWVVTPDWYMPAGSGGGSGSGSGSNGR